VDDSTTADSYSEPEQTVASQLVEEHYALLIRIARAKRRRAGMGETWNTIDLMHEGFARLKGRDDFASGPHFLRACILAMRHVIIDYARRRSRDKHGAQVTHVPLDEVESWLPEFSESPEELVAIAALLDDLERINPRWLRVVDARYFGGMTETEAALALGVSERTVRRDWQEARGWLATRLGRA
jgi:RNA polymerase sigma factor (TIGR02999 family)